jgi:hypothetical protein
VEEPVVAAADPGFVETVVDVGIGVTVAEGGFGIWVTATVGEEVG